MKKMLKVRPSHHCAIGIGYQANTLDKVAKLIGIPILKIC